MLCPSQPSVRLLTLWFYKGPHFRWGIWAGLKGSDWVCGLWQRNWASDTNGWTHSCGHKTLQSTRGQRWFSTYAGCLIRPPVLSNSTIGPITKKGATVKPVIGYNRGCTQGEKNNSQMRKLYAELSTSCQSRDCIGSQMRVPPLCDLGTGDWAKIADKSEQGPATCVWSRPQIASMWPVIDTKNN